MTPVSGCSPMTISFYVYICKVMAYNGVLIQFLLLSIACGVILDKLHLNPLLLLAVIFVYKCMKASI